MLAFVFIRGMDDKGGFYLPALKDRFFNYYLSRHKKGQVVEADNVLMSRIGELEVAEIKNRAVRRPCESFLLSGFWWQKHSTLYLQQKFAYLLADPMIHNQLLIILLKGIDDYYVALTSRSPFHTLTDTAEEVQTREPNRSEFDVQGDEFANSSSESAITIFKKKGRGKIAL